jgi:hypothetical protein
MPYAVSPNWPMTEGMAYDVNRKPGAWVSKQAARKSAYVWLLAAVLVSFALAAVGLVLSNRATVASSMAIIVGAIVLKSFADRRVDDAIHWLRGARAEVAVGEELDRLTAEGFIVKHDIEQAFDGNIDHFVSGRTGVFTIETKSRRYAQGDLPTARRRAKKLHYELGVWVTPVICVPRPKGKAFKTDGVWIVPLHRIVDWLREQQNRTADPERVARWASAR